MNSPLDKTLITALLSLAMLSGDLHSAANRVVLKAEASEEFIKERATDTTKKIQTYQFMMGKYYGGTTRDDAMREIPMEGVLHDLAINLQSQNFYLHKDLGEGDLLIVVHYGVTDYEISYEEFMGYNTEEDMGLTDEILNAGADGAAIDFATIDAMNQLNFNLSSSRTSGNANENSEYFKAQLLGMERAYYDNITSTEEYELKTMLEEERYFVVLMAYDYPLFKQGEIKLHWTTRYSIRALGQSFQDAIKDMNFVAADYFGKGIGGLTKKRVTDNSRVEMGDIEVIEQEPADPDQTK
jgi:hypothetical protein